MYVSLDIATGHTSCCRVEGGFERLASQLCWVVRLLPCVWTVYYTIVQPELFSSQPLSGGLALGRCVDTTCTLCLALETPVLEVTFLDWDKCQFSRAISFNMWANVLSVVISCMLSLWGVLARAPEWECWRKTLQTLLGHSCWCCDVGRCI